MNLRARYDVRGRDIHRAAQIDPHVFGGDRKIFGQRILGPNAHCPARAIIACVADESPAELRACLDARAGHATSAVQHPALARRPAEAAAQGRQPFKLLGLQHVEGTNARNDSSRIGPRSTCTRAGGRDHQQVLFKSEYQRTKLIIVSELSAADESRVVRRRVRRNGRNDPCERTARIVHQIERRVSAQVARIQAEVETAPTCNRLFAQDDRILRRRFGMCVRWQRE